MNKPISSYTRLCMHTRTHINIYVIYIKSGTAAFPVNIALFTVLVTV